MASGDFRRWPQNIIPYQFDSSVLNHPERRRLIEQAMHEWQAVTCLRFEPFSLILARQLGHRQRMFFQTHKEGCFADIGFKDPRRFGNAINRVNLDPTCWYKRTILHEIGHGLGLFHQHARPDRNEYLDVFEDNVNPKQLDQFEIPMSKWLVDLDPTIPYDYNSIMHYGKYYFAKKDARGRFLGLSMRPKEPCYADVIGRVRAISFYDAKLVNRIYKCESTCNQSLCSATQRAKNCYAAALDRKSCACHCPDESADKCHGAGTNFQCPLQDDLKCSNGYCIRRSQLCDGIDHCGNADDERSDRPLRLTLGLRNYTSCSALISDYPNYFCTNSVWRTRCCATCRQATSPCSDDPRCKGWSSRPNACKTMDVANGCPIMCGAARPDQPICFG